MVQYGRTVTSNPSKPPQSKPQPKNTLGWGKQFNGGSPQPPTPPVQQDMLAKAISERKLEVDIEDTFMRVFNRRDSV